MTAIKEIFPSLFAKNKNNLLIIAGPCQIESKELCFITAEFLKKITEELSLPFVFKASFDKANRTSIKSPRGVGLEKGLEILNEIKNAFHVPVLTDVHLPSQIEKASKVVDVIQIPAFLCRQTDLLIEAGKTGKPVHIKKGQFVHPEDMKFAVEKITSQNNFKVLLCERGTCFGYRDLVVDFRSICLLKKLNFPVTFDATHSVQQMGSASGRSAGKKEFAVPLAKAAAAVGVDGIFFECHPNPDQALSDKDIMLDFKEAENLLLTLENFIRP